MKKNLFISALVLMIASSTAVMATDNSTYTGQFINKHTQAITNKEKQLQQQQKARQEAQTKQKAELQKQIKAKQDAQAKQKAELQKKYEADKKARQQRVEQKKKQWNDLMKF